jgi:CRISPR-associated protein Cmr2
MSGYLLALSVGPVQEFISAARSTRDLAAGSRLLVTVARAAATAVQELGGTLIFPADTAADSAPNKILATLPGGTAPAAVAEGAREAARQQLREHWQRALREVPAGTITERLAADQVEHFLEFFAAWVPLKGDYPAARRRVEQLLAGRKALRDFLPPHSEAGRPKSPLDPARDCVLEFTPGEYTVSKRLEENPSLRLKRRETLDAISLVKRLAPHGAGVPSTSELAIRWLDARMDTAVLERLKGVVRESRGAFDLGDLFYEGRITEEEARQAGMERDELRRWVRQALCPTGAREAPAYYAVLHADGDRMGQLLGGLPDPEQHRKVSMRLVEFNQRAVEFIRDARGHAVYAGGDDVLALLPVPQAIPCALRLMEDYRQTLAQVAPAGARPSLTTGVAIVHHMEPLQEAVAHARTAEAVGKRARNSLAVALHTRGAEAVTVSLPLDEAAAWTEWQRAFLEGLSRGVPYELRALAREFHGTGIAEERLRPEVERIFQRKQDRDRPGGSPPGVGRTRRAPGWVQCPASLGQFARLLVIARFLTQYGQVGVAPELVAGGGV